MSLRCQVKNKKFGSYLSKEALYPIYLHKSGMKYGGYPCGSTIPGDIYDILGEHY